MEVISTVGIRCAYNKYLTLGALIENGKNGGSRLLENN
jgi:hypothetical protein